MNQTDKHLLLGFIAALYLIMPYIVYLEKPKGCADSVPDSVYREISTRQYVMHNIKNHWLWPLGLHGTNLDLQVEITTYSEVNKEFHKRWPNDKDQVWGFYSPSENKIICVDDTGVLIHELRHVFEIDFHR